MLIILGSILSGVIGVGIILIGARFLFAPDIAASGYGLPAGPASTLASAAPRKPWLHVKGLRDIASGIFVCILLANRVPHLLGAFMAAASIIPAGDAVIVLRGGGTRATAFGIHGVTAAVMLVAAAALFIA